MTCEICEWERTRQVKDLKAHPIYAYFMTFTDSFDDGHGNKVYFLTTFLITTRMGREVHIIGNISMSGSICQIDFDRLTIKDHFSRHRDIV